MLFLVFQKLNVRDFKFRVNTHLTKFEKYLKLLLWGSGNQTLRVLPPCPPPATPHPPAPPQLVEFYDEMQNCRLPVQVSVTKGLSQQVSCFPPKLVVWAHPGGKQPLYPGVLPGLFLCHRASQTFALHFPFCKVGWRNRGTSVFTVVDVLTSMFLGCWKERLI